MSIAQLPHYQELYTVCVQTGQILLDHFRTKMAVGLKPNGSVVSAADHDSERFLHQALCDILPQASFYGEESGYIGQQGESPYCWVVDPLDGTRNFIRGLPYFCISIALTYHGRPVISCVYQPYTQEFFYASQGEGTWCNGKKLLIEKQEYRAYGVLFVGDIDKIGQVRKKVIELYPVVTSIRKSGAAALDLAYVAAGYFDIACYGSMHWWDVAAGILLVEEAGGFVGSARRQSYRQGDMALIAGKKDLLRYFC